MNQFFDSITSYPTAVLTVLLVVVLFYWALALLGWIDIDAAGHHLHIDLQADGDTGELSGLAGSLVALGLNGVPFSIVVSLLVLVAWTLTSLVSGWLMPWLPGTLLHVIAGTVLLVISGALALPITALMIRPLKGLFVTHEAITNATLVGQSCVILSQSVDERIGRAEVIQRGASLQINVWTDQASTLQKGQTAYILEYDPDKRRYLVQSDSMSR